MIILNYEENTIRHQTKNSRLSARDKRKRFLITHALHAYFKNFQRNVFMSAGFQVLTFLKPHCYHKIFLFVGPGDTSRLNSKQNDVEAAN